MLTAKPKQEREREKKKGDVLYLHGLTEAGLKKVVAVGCPLNVAKESVDCSRFGWVVQRQEQMLVGISLILRAVQIDCGPFGCLLRFGRFLLACW
eukprot:3964823-Pleurochrysis_carterae.AAC.1